MTRRAFCALAGGSAAALALAGVAGHAPTVALADGITGGGGTIGVGGNRAGDIFSTNKWFDSREYRASRRAATQSLSYADMRASWAGFMDQMVGRSGHGGTAGGVSWDTMWDTACHNAARNMGDTDDDGVIDTGSLAGELTRIIGVAFQYGLNDDGASWRFGVTLTSSQGLGISPAVALWARGAVPDFGNGSDVDWWSYFQYWNARLDGRPEDVPTSGLDEAWYKPCEIDPGRTWAQHAYYANAVGDNKSPLYDYSVIVVMAAEDQPADQGWARLEKSTEATW